ncbi:MAG TPA: alpha/beta fold hydrolase [Steroidobacteraceae bacterium]|nr:alpha/beta fold hydrolase [Steroidobacteraceae bacterium]
MNASASKLHVERRQAMGDAVTAGAAAASLAIRPSDPLVMLHGWGMNLRVFDLLRDDLSDRETWAIDLPGHGHSAWWPGAAHFEAQRDAVLAALPPRCVLVGWSLGAKLALSIAAGFPRRVSALVLIAATPKHMQSPDWPQGMKGESLRAFQRALTQNWQQTLDDFVWLQLRGSRNAKEAQRTIAAALAAQGAPQPEALASGLALLASVDLRAEVGRITQPTLIITGQNDRVTSPEAARWLAAAIPHARLVELPRAGHAPLISHHSEVATTIRDFLTSTPGLVA